MDLVRSGTLLFTLGNIPRFAVVVYRAVRGEFRNSFGGRAPNEVLKAN